MASIFEQIRAKHIRMAEFYEAICRVCPYFNRLSGECMGSNNGKNCPVILDKEETDA